MVRKILKLRGISGEILKTAWRGNFRHLLALNRDIMLRSLLLQLCFGAITVLGARLGSDIIAVNAVLMTLLTFTAYALDGFAGNDSNLLIVFYVQIMPDDFVMQLHRF